MRETKVVVRFVERRKCNIEEADLVAFGRPAKSFDDIGSDGCGGAPELRGESVHFFARERGGNMVHVQDKPMRFLPNFQLFIRFSGHVRSPQWVKSVITELLASRFSLLTSLLVAGSRASIARTQSRGQMKTISATAVMQRRRPRGSSGIDRSGQPEYRAALTRSASRRTGKIPGWRRGAIECL